jgi:branched-subunit amino acid ABC-type transport system permease component
MLLQFVINGWIAGIMYGLISLSFIVIYKPAQFFHFAHGAVLTWAAYVCLGISIALRWPLWISTICTISVCAAGGAFLNWALYSPLRRRGATGLVLLLASLGLNVLLQNAISLSFGDETKNLASGNVTLGVPILGARVTPIQAWSVVVAVACFVMVGVMLKWSRFGRAFKAVSSNIELVKIDGISSDRVIMGAFILGSALAALAGILIALDVGMTPTMGTHTLMMGIVAMMVGGAHSIPGCLLGGILLGLAQHLGSWKFGSQWQDVIAFVVLILSVLIRHHRIMRRTMRKTRA